MVAAASVCAKPPPLPSSPSPARPTFNVLSPSQLDTLAELGEERTAAVGEHLFDVGDATYPFIAIREGEVAVLDAAGNEVVRHGASGFLGEMNLLSGQTVFLTAVVTEPMRYVAVEREVLRRLMFEDGDLADILLSAFVRRRELLQQRQGIGIEIIGSRDAPEARRLAEFARRARLPHSWRADRGRRRGRGAGRGPRRRPAAAGAPARGRSSSTGRATASSRARSGSGSSSHRARRSTW